MTTTLTRCGRRCAPSLRTHRRCPWLALVCLLLLTPASALAGKSEDARAHVAKATRAHKEGRFDEARVELEAAYAIEPKPELLYALGQVYAKLGNCDQAVDYYKRFAVTQTDPQIAQVIDQAIAACKLPEPAPTPGVDTEKPPEKPAEPPAPGPATTPKSPFAPNRSAPSSGPAPWYEDKLGDGLVIGGAVAAVIGLFEYRSALSDIDAAGSRDSTTTQARYDQLVDSAHGKRNASLVLFGAGTALIGAGIVRYVLRSADTEVHGVGIAPARGGGVVTYAGSF